MSNGGSIDLTFGSSAGVVEAGDGVDDPLAASEEMEVLAEEEESTDVDEPGESCQKPWLAVTVIGDENEPLAGAAYKVDLPSLKAEGTLDSQGFVHLDDVKESSDQITVKVLKEMADDGTETYSVEIVPKESETAEEEDLAFEADTDIYEPPWEPA
jgi:hypothetical protein